MSESLSQSEWSELYYSLASSGEQQQQQQEDIYSVTVFQSNLAKVRFVPFTTVNKTTLMSFSVTGDWDLLLLLLFYSFCTIIKCHTQPHLHFVKGSDCHGIVSYSGQNILTLGTSGLDGDDGDDYYFPWTLDWLQIVPARLLPRTVINCELMWKQCYWVVGVWYRFYCATVTSATHPV